MPPKRLRLSRPARCQRQRIAFPVGTQHVFCPMRAVFNFGTMVNTLLGGGVVASESTKRGLSHVVTNLGSIPAGGVLLYSTYGACWIYRAGVQGRGVH